MSAWRRRSTAAVGFALLALIAELTGRSLTASLDRACHVVPLATPTTRYYPFLLAGVRSLAALVLAAVAWRLVRAHVTASAGERLLEAIGHRDRRRLPQLQLTIEPRLWLVSFATTALWYLVQTDAQPVAEGRWPPLGPWLHTYSLPVFAVLAVLLAISWGAVRDWLADVESYAAATLAHVRRILRARSAPVPPPRPAGDRAPRRLFGLAFESRPPPLPV